MSFAYLFLGFCLFAAGLCIGIAVCAILTMAKSKDEEYIQEHPIRWEPHRHEPPEIEMGED